MMSRYNAVEDLHRCMSALETQLQSLRQRLPQLRLLAGRVWTLPEIKKGQEHDAIINIPVTQHLSQNALSLALNHYSRLFMQHQSETVSTKAAVRLPGVICFEAMPGVANEITDRVKSINNLKHQLEQIITVESGVAAEERFEFVHTHLRGLITLNAYRTITTLNAPDSVRFGWANKHIIKNVTRDEMVEKLEKSLKSGRAIAPWTREQWAEKLQDEMAVLKNLPGNVKLKIKRPVKVQPIARIWNKQQQKQTQLPCASPMLILCPDAASVPKLGELMNYDAENITHRFKPAAASLESVIPRLHLYKQEVS